MRPRGWRERPSPRPGRGLSQFLERLRPGASYTGRWNRVTNKKAATHKQSVRSREKPVSANRHLLTADDFYLFNEGSHLRLYRKLGAHPATMDGVSGTHFAVWAPDAERVSVIGDFNG